MLMLVILMIDFHRFILSSEIEADESIDAFDEDAEERAKEREQQHRNELLEQVDFNT